MRAQTTQISPSWNSNCLQLLGGRVSWVPPAAGVAFPPELPAGTSGQPTCLSWQTESYLIPENLSINRGVTRPADGGTHIWTTKEFNWSPRGGAGIYPGIKRVWNKTGVAGFQVQRVNSQHLAEFIASQKHWQGNLHTWKRSFSFLVILKYEAYLF